MALPESRHYLMNQPVSHHKLDLPFLHLLHHPALSYKWLAAIQRAELAVAEHLP